MLARYFWVSNFAHSDILESEIFAALKIYFGITHFDTSLFAVIGSLDFGRRSSKLEHNRYFKDSHNFIQECF